MAGPAPRSPRPAAVAALLIAALLCAPAAAAHGRDGDSRAGAETPHRPFVASYELRHRSMLAARTERTLSRDGDGLWIYESRTEPAGLLSAVRRDRVVERSEWRADGPDQRPRPLHYEYRHTRRGGERHVTLRFDWEREPPAVTMTVNGESWQMAIPAAVQDKLLYQYTISLDLAAGIADFIYEVADGGELKTYRFEHTGTEALDTALGRLTTERLERTSGSRRTVIWFSPAHDYLPVRVEQHREGKVAVMTIDALDKGEEEER